MLTTGAWLQDYMDNLHRETEEMLAAQAAARAERQKPLRVKIGEWYASLPPPHRKPYYTMDELVKQFNVAPASSGKPSISSVGSASGNGPAEGHMLGIGYRPLKLHPTNPPTDKMALLPTQLIRGRRLRHKPG